MDAAAGDGGRWTEEVDDLVDAGDVEGAISLLESVVSNLSTTAASPSSPGADLRLATALGDLAGLHSSRGNTLQADAIRSRAIVLRLRAEKGPQALGGLGTAENSSSPEAVVTGSTDPKASANADEKNEDEDDDWEAIADRGDETPVRPLEQEARVSSSEKSSAPSSEKSSTPSSGPKRRGRGSFLYEKSVMYSDQCGSERDLDDKGSDPRGGSKGDADEQEKTGAERFGTRHALVLYDFPSSTRITDLERIFEKFGDHGVSIRWVNDSIALAVFRTPSSANEAQACVPPRYKVRPLKDNDDLLAKIDDLEPPMPRPKTSARTAQRLIAHGMGLKQFSSPSPGERKEQEEARRSRITARQAARDDAWGSD